MLKRKDDIRRRLTIAEVPKPPVDLAHRIKRDIPKHYTSKTAKQIAAEQTSRETVPGWNFWGFSWQLAASVLVLVGLTWAVFEAWEKESTQVTQVTDAKNNVMTVDEFEAEVTGTADSRVIEAQAAPEKSKDRIEMDGEMTEAAANEFARRQDFAPEPSQRAAPSGAKKVAEAEVLKPLPAAPPPQPAVETSAVEGRDASASEIRGGIGQTKSQMADAVVAEGVVPVDGTAAPAAGDLARTAAKSEPVERYRIAEEAVSEANAPNAPREVRVNGLKADRVVEVELRLDERGSVAEAKVIGVKDVRIVEAVRKAASNWTFADADDATREKRLTTIKVRLRPID